MLLDLAPKFDEQGLCPNQEGGVVPVWLLYKWSLVYIKISYIKLTAAIGISNIENKFELLNNHCKIDTYHPKFTTQCQPITTLLSTRRWKESPLALAVGSSWVAVRRRTEEEQEKESPAEGTRARRERGGEGRSAAVTNQDTSPRRAYGPNRRQLDKGMDGRITV